MNQASILSPTESRNSTGSFATVDSGAIQFPSENGHNLLRKNLHLPDDFEGSLNIVFVAFQRWQQNDIDSWMPLTAELEASWPDVMTYELPVIYKMNRLSKMFINEGMRAGIPNNTTRSRTITLYTDKTAFRRQLQLPTEDTMYVLLVDDNGQVVWRTEGPFTHSKATHLINQIETRS